MSDSTELKRTVLAQHLRRHVAGEVRFDATSRRLYSTDASIYRIEPLGVVMPRTAEDVVAVVQIAGEMGVPITARGGGTSQDPLPSPPREFRGVWVATVGNLDWPSRPGLTTAQQQAELLALLDRAAALKLNAVIFQVRPMADALYASEREPWSEYLTGTAGRAPAPLYDPLELAVREAHARGLELHAWFNPYRARHPSAASPAPANHLVKSRPDLARPYGKHHWLNPTSREVQDHSVGVILDVVRRYDVDGVHIDDYFYPYREKDADGRPIPFPDDDTWAEYRKSDGPLSRDDWRRAAVNRFVERMYKDCTFRDFLTLWPDPPASSGAVLSAKTCKPWRLGQFSLSAETSALTARRERDDARPFPEKAAPWGALL